MEHDYLKPWWQEAVTVRLEHLPRRSLAVTAEALAIAKEKPLYNIPARAGAGSPLPPTQLIW